MTIRCAGHEFELLPQRAVWWPSHATLIVSDIHAGKTMHFRKSGISIPQAAQQTDIERMEQLVRSLNPKHLIVTGDMFHSGNNAGVGEFLDWRMGHMQLQVTLVMGNHDMHQNPLQREHHIEVVENLLMDGIGFSHKPEQTEGANLFFCGHLHPGYALRGKGRQSLRLPCFYKHGSYLVLPAFSVFTGLYRIQPGPGDNVYVIAAGEVIQVM